MTRRIGRGISTTNGADPLATLRGHLRNEVAAGFYSDDAILTNAIDYFENEIDADMVRREAPGMLRELLADQAAAEAHWPETTDCDRLDAAFAALEANGIIARQNFSCCQSCGWGEIGDEVRAIHAAGLPARGCTFYHVQDTEGAIEGHGIFLSYAAWESGDDAALSVGHEIQAELKAHGLKPEWNGSLEQRIRVPMDWKRRRSADLRDARD
jgi:hypothetical protein